MQKKADQITQFLCHLLCAVTAILCVPESHADYVSLTGAETAANIVEVELDRDTLTLTFEISAADAEKFWPDIAKTDDLHILASHAAKRDNLQFGVNTGNKALPPNRYAVAIAERKQRISPFAGKKDPRTGQILPDFPTDNTILRVEVEYALTGVDRVILQPPEDSSGLASVNIGFITRHGATVVNNFAYLSRAETLLIDWRDPWNTRYDNPNIRRHSRAPVMSFLYIEARQVRHDILLRPSKLADWTDQPFDAWQPLTASTLQQLAAATTRYFRAKNPASIDGTPIEPRSIETAFLKATDTGFALIPDSQHIELGSTLIGCGESYAVKQLPARVDVHWQLFDGKMNTVPTLIQDPAGAFPTHTTTTFPTIEWQNFLQHYTEPDSAKVPAQIQRLQVLSLFPLLAMTVLLLAILSRYYPAKWRWFRRTLTNIAIGFPVIVVGFLILPARFATPLPWPVSDRQLTAVTQELLTQVAAAYQERDEQKLHTTLADLVSASAFTSTANNLASVYQPATSVGGRGQTGSLSGLQLQHLERFEFEGKPAFRAVGDWQASIEGHYWGHSDRRQYQIRASFEIRQEGDSWKIAAFTPLRFN